MLTRRPASACQVGRQSIRHQRGAASLVVTMVLFFAMLLAAAYANRNVVFDHRAAANQVRATQAFEAAEAGLEWALAQLNAGTRIGGDCRNDTTAPGTFRQRLMRAAADGRLTGATWNDPAQPLQAACVRTEAGWACHCPTTGHPVPPATPEGALAPAFSVEFAAGDKPGVVRLRVRGCTRAAQPCLPGSAELADASARVEVTLGLLGALAAAPKVPLTLRGTLQSDASLGLHNADPASGGHALHAGGLALAPNLRLSAPAGSSLADAIVAGDAALAGIAADLLFERQFGQSRAAWRRLPGVRSVDCRNGCAAALAAAAAAQGGPALLWVDGDASIDGPLTLGSPQQPLILVVDGTLHLRGAVQLHGLVHTRSARWDDATPGSGAGLRGALVSEAGFGGTAAPDLQFDAALLDALRRDSGSFARVSGSWRDF